MLEYQLCLESATAELRAFETYNNLHSFLDGVSLDLAMEGSFRESLSKFKNMIIKFFKSIADAIYRFFVRLFGQGDRLMHKRAITILVEALKKWNKELLSLDISSFLADLITIPIKSMTQTKPGLSSSSSESVMNTVSYIDQECEETKEKVLDLLSTYPGKGEYKMIGKYELSILNTFPEGIKNSINKMVSEMEHNISPINNDERKMAIFQSRVTNILNMAAYVEKTAMELVIECSWDSRLENNETRLKTPVEIEIMD